MCFQTDSPDKYPPSNQKKHVTAWILSHACLDRACVIFVFYAPVCEFTLLFYPLLLRENNKWSKCTQYHYTEILFN